MSTGVLKDNDKVKSLIECMRGSDLKLMFKI